jgi:hypothetical protein
LLDSEIKELEKMEFDIDLLGFKEGELDVLLAPKGENDPNDEWHDMPEFASTAKGECQIIVYFKNRDDVDLFARKMNQKITDKTKSIWFNCDE